MDLKRLMTEYEIKAKGFIDSENTDTDLKILKKRNDSTAFNIYQLKVEEKPPKQPKYKNPLKNIGSRVDALLKTQVKES